MKKVFLANIPDLVAIQKTSFCWFLEEGLANELSELSKLADFMETYEVRFFTNEYYFYYPFRTYNECRRDKLTYSIRMYIPIEVEDRRTQITESHVICLCELPLMTNRATFMINGCERVILGQIVRSPGVYYKVDSINHQISSINATLISDRGSWLYFEYDREKLIWIKTDRLERIPLSILLDDIGNESEGVLGHLENAHYFEYIKAYAKKIYIKEDNFEYEEYLSRWELLKEEIFDPRYYNLGKVGRFKLNKKLSLSIPTNIHGLTIHDLVEIIDYLIGLRVLIGNVDDIDSLENRRIRSVGELLQAQFNQAFMRFGSFLEETRDMMNTLDLTALINPLPVQSAVDEFFVTNPLSQYLDQINPLAEVIHKRRVTVLGPGGIPFEKASLAMRDIHPSYYGRLCPIDTPEGEKAGLVASLATFVDTDTNGFLKTPFFAIKKGQICGLSQLSVADEEGRSIAMGDVLVNTQGYLLTDRIETKQNDEFNSLAAYEIDYLSISPFQFFSPAIGLIPFFEHDDANRTLMGAHMQRQAVPLVRPQKPIVGTGIEYQLAIESGCLILSYSDGIVRSVSSTSIWIIDKSGKVIAYKLEKFQSSNQATVLNQRPIVWSGERVKSGQVIGDGPSTDEGELSLGKNVTVAYMPWGGYNYEDAVVVSERLVYENVFTSVHVEKLEVEIQNHDRGPDYITREIPEINEEKYKLRNLDENGIVYVGAYVQPGDALVGKLSPKRRDNTYGRLLEELFGDTPAVNDSSLRVPLGLFGRTLEVRILDQESSMDLSSEVLYVVQVFIAHIRRIQVGDKISGRHGNKGVISLIAPRADLPFLSDGTIVDIILNPLGVPSRMNVGQLFECLMGWAGDKLNERYKIFPFDEVYESENSRILVYEKLRQVHKKSKKTFSSKTLGAGKVKLYDGRSGQPFDNLITVGKPYILKLIHLVDDKIHARSIGPYSIITQQPLGGRSREGGQRFGEMEVWALEAFGTAHTLQEVLTIKSDDIHGRLGAYRAIVSHSTLPSPGIPESFRVLLRELRSLAVDIRALRFVTHSYGKLEPGIKSVRF
uniref:DNA-directed RNA polymerase subunit beta n=1 Tax=Eustigmatophyceae sp. Mont 10/10-1w TaxID=2506145 RepID=A0A451FMT7_9STRA|nr:RNA polymerase subunit beta [Eustigmatophyceae sp. Mont 10/10-1w]QAA11731.1 RNA polymerase subunit beta [Eustigmatophyceae sp. Mont 10/10-1w]